MKLYEIPRKSVLVTGARLKTNALVKLGCFKADYSTICPRVGIWIGNDMFVWVTHFDQLPICAIKGNVTLSAQELMVPPKEDSDDYREYVLSMVLRANLKQIRFDIDKKNRCEIWLNNITEKRSSIFTAEPINLWSCFDRIA